MRITDLKCAVIGRNPVVRIVTDEGLDGYGEVEASKSYLTPYILDFKPALLGQDPTDIDCSASSATLCGPRIDKRVRFSERCLKRLARCSGGCNTHEGHTTLLRGLGSDPHAAASPGDSLSQIGRGVASECSPG